MPTRIIPTRTVGRRRGTRSVPALVHTDRRYDIHGGDGHYRYSETRRYSGRYDRTVETSFAIVEPAPGRIMEFDTGADAPVKGSEVHVLEHRILGRTIHDLYEDAHGLIRARGADPFPGTVGRLPASLLAAIVATCCLLLDVEFWHGVTYGCWSGVALHILRHAVRSHGSHRLASLRREAVRRIRTSARSG